uniref:Uncharacterized protein n=1 Tax=Staphylococcus aureus TaxID=1280 RepID=Q8VVR9_STAAU|nr:unnamed protein product [Staphylococcus aureus]
MSCSSSLSYLISMRWLILGSLFCNSLNLRSKTILTYSLLSYV